MQSKVHLSRSRAPFAILVALFLALALAAPAQAFTDESDISSDEEPQSISKADSNEGGANGQCPDEGPYCSTRDGSDSENGNGDGKSTGKPCAGCVGKADNKNPQGQSPNADEDGNNGYECDDNNGIGKGNPAHTACDEDEATTSDEPDDSDEVKPDETGTSQEPGSPDQPGNSDEADAVDGVDSPPVDEVAGVELEAQPNTDEASTGAAAQAARTAPMALPQTGAPDSLLLLLAGLGLAGVGGLTLLLRRRSASNG